MAKQGKREFALTASGYEYDKELARLSVKVFPALQALIANQHDLIEISKTHAPEKSIFLEAHLAELVEVEETIAKEYAKHCAKREELKMKRQNKDKIVKDMPQPEEKNNLQYGYDEHVKETEALLDEAANRMSPGLPSARFATSPRPSVKQEDKDIRRIAIGASIKALSALLGRKLNEQELSVIESQVDSYL
ncbi:hypothetical protein L7E55_15850 [Pelotomaculum isophthalicicum JI]|uniref:Uncharacterized protein n=1 Tax=Pelotomaculum isophthalicicum JI TaxID=947010 RepID=A0A9X4JU38_9FIRM|nr:hypothetical protein [Pelotomaculum isophthalicicum]MDF9409804.1 hypothetical protein [Pelotomaculum isophthalicicum JI]